MGAEDSWVICTSDPEGTGDPEPYYGAIPRSAELVHYAVAGFEIPSLPALSPDNARAQGDLVGSVLYRFRSYLCELHAPGMRRSIALQFTADPELSNLGARVRCYVLCRSAHEDDGPAKADAVAFEHRARSTFPQEGLFAYGGPRRLRDAELKRATFAGVADRGGMEIVEIRKHEEILPIWSQPSLHYVPHRFWADQRRDPWLSIIETLAQATKPMAVRVELQPVRITAGQGLDFVSLAGRWFSVINEDLTRKASQGEQVRTDGVVTEEMTRQDLVSTAASNAATFSYVRRGRHIYEGLTTFADTAFCMRVTLAADGSLPEAVIGSVRSALSTPPAGDPEAAIGWVRPDIVRPDPDEADAAVRGFGYLMQPRWGSAVRNVAHEHRIDLRPVVTPDEAVSLFHVPIYDRPGQTSALSTAEAPFVIPPETLDTNRIKPDENGALPKTVMIGHMYQREQLLGQPFLVTMDDLMKPSLLVGAPGSGKTNLAFSMLIQLWRDHRVPFLVLDPSTGQEFRMLLRHQALKDDLVVFTVGDRDENPLQFNPFSVPPGVTVRNHATRILAAFRAAFQMPDPVPAIYEGALERIYTDTRYASDGESVMEMEQKGGLKSPAPTLANFAAAIRDEVNEKAVGLYEGAKESIGVIRGASTIRVNAIGKKIGHIVNVEGNNGTFMQNLLKRPVVIELGGLGDSSNISLVMAFLLTQLAGHIEHAFREDEKRQNVMFIEEAHRLLGAGETEGVESKSAEDLNMMLAEVRKFGQGILVMDQRPSSLVGGVLDNAYIKILTRLSDRVGFDRLSSELNLNEAQQRYARTRLKTGDAILLDRDAGQPVLMRSEGVKKELEKIRVPLAEVVAQMHANARAAELVPPKSTAYVEPGIAGGAAVAKEGDSSAVNRLAGAQAWLAQRTQERLDTAIKAYEADKDIHWIPRDILEAEKDPAKAKRALEEHLRRNPKLFEGIASDIHDMLQWALIGRLLETRFSGDETAHVQWESLRDVLPNTASKTADSSAKAAE